MIYSQIHLTLPSWVLQEIDVSAIYSDAEARMALAIYLARRNVELQTGGPFGAVVFNEEGRVVSVGVNRVVIENCSLAHAETMAFMTAQTRLQKFRLNMDGGKYILATSAQPCCQCYGAAIWAGIDEILIGARSEDVHELTEFDEGPLPADWAGELQKRGIIVKRDVLRENARAVLAYYRDQGGLRY